MQKTGGNCLKRNYGLLVKTSKHCPEELGPVYACPTQHTERYWPPLKCDYLIKRQHNNSKSQKGGITAIEETLVHDYIADHLLGTIVMKIL